MLPLRVKVELGVNEDGLGLPQSSRITGASPLDCFVSYQGQSLREYTDCISAEGYSAEMQSVYSAAPAD